MRRGGNMYNKYATRNPIARHLMTGFLNAFDELAQIAEPRTAFDAGCGEGYLSERLASRGITVSGCDADSEIVADANNRLASKGLCSPFFVSGINAIPLNVPSSDLVVCCEVLEHVDQPEMALDRLVSLSRAYLLLSVPREPIWRILNVIRGAYWDALGNTPGHVNHWSASAFLALVESRTKVVAVRNPLPWTMVLSKLGD